MSPSYETTLKEQYQITSTDTEKTLRVLDFMLSGVCFMEVSDKERAIQLIRSQPFF